MGDRTAKSRLLKINMTEFADDVAVYAATREALEQVAAEFVNTAVNWGLTVSLEKTKLLTLGKQLKPEDNLPVQLDGGDRHCRRLYLSWQQYHQRWGVVW